MLLVVFWLHPAAVVDTQTSVIVPMNSADWRSKKGQFDVMTEKTWPNTVYQLPEPKYSVV